ncbi:putative Zinc finger, RING-type [Septoria linicola]|nr:putative Zinc finger, RING-type [Septoria linicola]
MAQSPGATAQLTPVAAENASNCYGANEDCSICYEELVRPTRTACKHVFCLECLETWLQKHNTCPACRRRLYGYPAIDQDGSDDDVDFASDSEGEGHYDDDDDDDSSESEDEHEVGPSSANLPATVVINGELLQERLLSLYNRGFVDQEVALPEWVHDLDRHYYTRFTFSLTPHLFSMPYVFDHISYERGRRRRERRRARLNNLARSIHQLFGGWPNLNAVQRVVSYALVNGETYEEVFRRKTNGVA